MDIRTPAFAYLPDEADLRRIFADWPAGTCLAVCLEDDGSCLAVPFSATDLAGIGPRLTDLLQRPAHEISVFPALAGHPEAELLYSDEQRLIALLAAGDPETVLAPVRDFAMNDSFARDEGMEPAALVGQFRIRLIEAGPAPASLAATPRTVEPRRSEPLLPPADAAPPGFVRLGSGESPTCQRTTGLLRTTESGFVVQADDADATPGVREAAAVFVRDDLRAFALECGIDAPVGRAWRLPAEALPRDLRLAPGGAVRVEICQIGQRLFVTPCAPHNASPDHASPALDFATDPVPAAPDRAAPAPAAPPDATGRPRALMAGLTRLQARRPDDLRQSLRNRWARPGEIVLDCATGVAVSSVVLAMLLG